MAWRFRSLIGCLREYQRTSKATCALIVQEDAAILAKVTTDAQLDTDTLGVCAAMIFGTSRMLLRDLHCAGETVVGRITIGTEYHLHVLGITSRIALATLYRNGFSTGLLEHEARAISARMLKCLLGEGVES